MHTKQVSKFKFVPPLCLNGMVEQSKGNCKTAFACFGMVESFLALDQPFIHSIVSLFAGGVTHRSVKFTTLLFVITHLLLRTHTLYARTICIMPT